MTEITQSPAGRQRPGFGKANKLSLRVDMTPMVDLGFLLISFFVFTAELNKPFEMTLYMPKDGPPSKIEDENVLSVLLERDDQVYYYPGTFEDATLENSIERGNYDSKTGLGDIIRKKLLSLDKNDKTSGREKFMLLIKPGENSNYRNIVDALDEAIINGVKKYAIIEQSSEEKDYISKKGH